jgi:hypothetical protein
MYRHQFTDLDRGSDINSEHLGEVSRVKLAEDRMLIVFPSFDLNPQCHRDDVANDLSKVY